MEIKNNDTGLYMIEGIDSKSGIIVLADYIFDKKISHQATAEEVEIYECFFYDALDRNIFLHVEYDEKRKIIVQ